MAVKKVSLSDKILSCLTYLTAGWFGIFTLIALYFLKKKPTKFIRFNIMQSIFVAILFFIVSLLLGWTLKILSYIPFLNYIVAYISFQFTRAVFLDYSIVQTFMIGLTLYMAGFSLFGKYPKVYWVSDVIAGNVK